MPQKRSLADDVVECLREAIWTGNLPPGMKLREEQLAEFLGVSRGPIREALGQLEREGLVIREPNKGATVARLSREDLEEVYSLRLGLERLAVTLAVRNAEAQQLAEMQSVVGMMAAAVERGITEQEAATLDIRFHEILCQASKHKRLLNFWAILRPQIYIFFLSRNVANSDFREHIVTSHQGIFDAVRDHDETRAIRLLEEHLRDAYERILPIYPQ